MITVGSPIGCQGASARIVGCGAGGCPVGGHIGWGTVGGPIGVQAARGSVGCPACCGSAADGSASRDRQTTAQYATTTPPQASSAAVWPKALTSTGATSEPAAMPAIAAGSASP